MTKNPDLSFSFNTTPAIIFENGGTRRLGEITAKRLGKSVLFVTDPGLRAFGLADGAVHALAYPIYRADW